LKALPSAFVVTLALLGVMAAGGRDFLDAVVTLALLGVIYFPF
jgi:hypothetical protein